MPWWCGAHCIQPAQVGAPLCQPRKRHPLALTLPCRGTSSGPAHSGAMSQGQSSGCRVSTSRHVCEACMGARRLGRRQAGGTSEHAECLQTHFVHMQALLVTWMFSSWRVSVQEM